MSHTSFAPALSHPSAFSCTALLVSLGDTTSTTSSGTSSTKPSGRAAGSRPWDTEGHIRGSHSVRVSVDDETRFGSENGTYPIQSHVYVEESPQVHGSSTVLPSGWCQFVNLSLHQLQSTPTGREVFKFLRGEKLQCAHVIIPVALAPPAGRPR